MLLRQQGYWTTTSFKVNLTKDEKRRIGRASTPRWELDVLAYKGATNEVLAVECKSFLDSRGVVFQNGQFERPKRYKLFNDQVLRDVVLKRLATELQESGLCAPDPRVTLCLAAGKLASVTDRDLVHAHCRENGWQLFDPDWIRDRLRDTADRKYENDISFVVSKLLLRAEKTARRARRSRDVALVDS